MAVHQSDSTPAGPRRGSSPRATGRAETRSESRRRDIATLVLSEGSATVQELASRFDVSIVTVHRDLDELEHRGVVRKFHGGVSAQPSGVFESQLGYRLATNLAAKAAIAAAALDYVQPGMSILLDDSTSVLAMVPGLAERGPLHVATTFLRCLRELADLAEAHELQVIGLGGRYDAAHDAFVGVQTTQQVQSLHVDALFFSTSAVSGSDMFHQEEQIASLKRAMLASATSKYLLIDHSKLGRLALLKIASLRELTLIITDEGADPEVLRQWTEAGVAFRIAPPLPIELGGEH